MGKEQGQKQTKSEPDKLTWWPSSAGPEGPTCHVFVAPSLSPSVHMHIPLSFVIPDCRLFLAPHGVCLMTGQLQSAAMISINYGTNSLANWVLFPLKWIFICISLIRQVRSARPQIGRAASGKSSTIQSKRNKLFLSSHRLSPQALCPLGLGYQEIQWGTWLNYRWLLLHQTQLLANESKTNGMGIGIGIGTGWRILGKESLPSAKSD